MAAEQPRVQLVAFPGHARIGHEGSGMWRKSGSSSGRSSRAQNVAGLQGSGHLELGGGDQVGVVLGRQLWRRIDVRGQGLDVRQAGLTLRHRRSSGPHGEGSDQARWRHTGHHHWTGTSSRRMHYCRLGIVGRLLLLGRRGMGTADQQSGRRGGLRRLRGN